MRRKTFLKNTLLSAAAITIVPRHVLGGNGYIAPNDRINLGFIGTGKQARGLMKGMSKLAETVTVAACDVDKKKLELFVNQAKTEGSANKKPAADITSFAHYRELLER